MSETDTQPRNEDTGQFVPSTELLVGREAELVAAGYTVKKDDPSADGEIEASYEDGWREAAAAAVEARKNRPTEISLDEYREALGKPDPNEAVTAKQAAEENASSRADVSRFVEGVNLADFAAQIDKGRAEAIKNNPRAAEEMGLSAEDIEAAKNADK